MFQVPVTTGDIATSTHNLTRETGTQVVSTFNQEVQTQTYNITMKLAELEKILHERN
jgi:hypothetical protein